MLDACDELGVYVMDEAFDMWLIHKNPYDYAGDVFREWWQRDVSAMAVMVVLFFKFDLEKKLPEIHKQIRARNGEMNKSEE